MSLILAMCGFAFAMSASPGPVNIMTLSSGLSHGVAKTVPFVLGATIGFTVLLVLTGLGILQAVAAYPILMDGLRVCGAGFMLYMAYRLFTSGGGFSAEETRQLTFWEGVLLQWLNPKAWIVCISGVSAFVAQGETAILALFSSLYFAICFIGVGLWAVVGAKSQRFIAKPAQIRLLNRVMAVAMALAAGYLLVSGTG